MSPTERSPRFITRFIVIGIFMCVIAWAVGDHVASVTTREAVHESNVALRRYAASASRRVNVASRQRSIDTCNRGNPGRAYLQLRAGEVSTPTARVSHLVWGLLDCERVVDHGGRPYPLSRETAREYLALFHRGRVPTVVHGTITGSVSMSSYFK